MILGVEGDIGGKGVDAQNPLGKGGSTRKSAESDMSFFESASYIYTVAPDSWAGRGGEGEEEYFHVCVV